MSVVRFVTHIVPSNTSFEAHSNLSPGTGIPQWSEQMNFACTTSDSGYLLEDSMPDRNSNNNASMDSVPLKQQGQIPMIAAASGDGNCPGILVSVPLHISRHNIDNPIHKNSNTNDDLAQSGFERFTDTQQSCSVAEENPTVVDVVEPLEKYFRGDTCLLCGFVSSAKWQCSARMHLITHLTENNFKCDVCNKGFTTPDYLRNHMKTHSSHQPPTLLFSCSKCGKSFITKRKLRRHEKIHDETRGIQCEFCDVKLCSQQSLKTHLTIHTGELGFQCAVCSKKFRTSDSLRVHSLTHNSEKRYVCDVCKKGYNNKSLYTQHLNTHTEEGNSFKCEECGKRFNFQSNLLQHQLTHSDIRRHACAFCNKKFKLAHHLKSHLATHSEQHAAP